MRARRVLKPGAAPARVLKFLRRNPDARSAEMARVLGIKLSTIEMALTRLVQMGVYQRPKRAPRMAKPKEPELSPGESLERVRAQFSAAAAIGPSLRCESQPEVHPTGTPFVVVDGVMRAGSEAVQVFGISGAHVRAPDYSHHQGTTNTPSPAHPWGFANCRTKPGG